MADDSFEAAADVSRKAAVRERESAKEYWELAEAALAEAKKLQEEAE